MEERFLQIDEGIHNAQARENSVQEAICGRNFPNKPEPPTTKGSKIQKLKGRSKGGKYNSRPQSPGSDRESYASSQITTNTRRRRYKLRILSILESEK